MAQVLIRNLDEAVVRRLKARAQANGRSLESELRTILHRESLSNVAEASVPYGRPQTEETATHIEEPPGSGILWPKRPPRYRKFKPIKLPPGVSASEMIIRDRQDRI